jgi:predicted MPP superfamily phosphohydrolase
VIRRAAAVAGAAAAVVAGWSLFESQWVEFREQEVALRRLPPELDGLTIVHLSDFHLGTLSFNGRTLDRAVRWASERPCDIVAITGDLLSRRRGEPQLEAAVAALEPRFGVFAVLGNHDVEITRDPFSQPTDASVVQSAGAVLLENDSALLELNEKSVQIVGGDPSLGPYWSSLARLADPAADLRILLFHFPDVVRYLPPGAFDLVLAGHLHGGQICIPTPRGKVRLEHLRAQHWDGLHETPAGVLHVSRGLGASFVPFRFFARPEATRLVLRSAAS